MSDRNFTGSIGCETHVRIGTGSGGVVLYPDGKGNLLVSASTAAVTPSLIGLIGEYPGIISTHPLPYSAGSSSVAVANNVRLARITVPTSGTIVDFSYFVVATASGNVDGAIMSTAATRVRLWSNGGTAIGSANSWQSLGNPNLAVQRGDQYDVGIAMDTITTVTFACQTLQNANLGTLPTGYLPQVAASPKMCSTATTSYPIPATIAEASLTTSSLVPLILMRIV